MREVTTDVKYYGPSLKTFMFEHDMEQPIFVRWLPFVDELYCVQVDFDADISSEEMQMMAAMGVPFGFATTQGKHVEDDAVNAGAVKAKQTRKARQYMNRKGGFNRPLPAERTGEVVPRD